MLTWWFNTQTTHGLRGWPILLFGYIPVSLRFSVPNSSALCQLSHVNNRIANAHKNITLINGCGISSALLITFDLSGIACGKLSLSIIVYSILPDSIFTLLSELMSPV